MEVIGTLKEVIDGNGSTVIKGDALALLAALVDDIGTTPKSLLIC